MNTKNAKLIIFILVIFTFQDGLGLRAENWGGIGTKTFGFYGLIQILLTIFVFAWLLLNNINLISDTKNLLFRPSMFIFALFLLAIIEGIIQGLLGGGTGFLMNIFSNLFKTRYYLFFFIIVSFVKNYNDILLYFKTVYLLAIVSAVILLFIIASGKQTYIIAPEYSNMAGREFRVITPTSSLLALGFFIAFTDIMLKKKNNFISLIILAASVLIQMHRSLLLALSLTLIIYFVSISRLSSKNFVKNLIFVFIFLALGVKILSTLSLSTDAIVQTFISSQDELSAKQGNIWVRIFLMLNSWSYVIKNYYFIGIGFDWVKEYDVIDYLTNQFVKTPTFDNSYNNIIIVFGLLGLAVYGYFFYKLIRVLKKLIKDGYDINIKAMATTLYLMVFYSLIVGTGTDIVLINNTTIITIIVWGLSFVLETINRKLIKHSINEL